MRTVFPALPSEDLGHGAGRRTGKTPFDTGLQFMGLAEEREEAAKFTGSAVQIK